MAGDNVKDRWRGLAADAAKAFGSDFRYAEEMARQAVSLNERKQARQQKKSETPGPRAV